MYKQERNRKVMQKHCGTLYQDEDLNYAAVKAWKQEQNKLSTLKVGKSILPCISLAPSKTLQLSSALKRRQFAIIPALTVITHKSQMQTSKPVGIYLA